MMFQRGGAAGRPGRPDGRVSGILNAPASSTSGGSGGYVPLDIYIARPAGNKGGGGAHPQSAVSVVSDITVDHAIRETANVHSLLLKPSAQSTPPNPSKSKSDPSTTNKNTPNAPTKLSSTPPKSVPQQQEAKLKDKDTTTTTNSLRKDSAQESPKASPPRVQQQEPQEQAHEQVVEECAEPAFPPDLIKSVEKAARKLFRIMEKNKWEKLVETLKTMQEASGPAFVREVLTKRNNSSLQESPLHIVAAAAPAEVAKFIFQMVVLLEKGSIHANHLMFQQDVDGNTPLHLACANVQETNTNFAVIRNALLAAPHAMDMFNSNGDTPLHLLVASKAFSSASLSAAATANLHNSSGNLQEPSSASKESSAVIAEQAIVSLLSMVPSAATRQNEEGLTLLHIAIANQAHDRILRQLIKKAPEAAGIADKRGMLPLHYVAAVTPSSRNTAWVKDLIQAKPDSIFVKTKDGDTPLHLLMSNARENIHLTHDQNDDDVFRKVSMERMMDKDSVELQEHKNNVMLLVDQLIGAISIVNHEGLCPLHVAVMFKAPPEVVRLLAEASPLGFDKASSVANRNGDTALHMAVNMDDADEQLVLALATPHACSTQDSAGRTPLVIAIQKKTQPLVVKTLLHAYQESKLQKNFTIKSKKLSYQR